MLHVLFVSSLYLLNKSWCSQIRLIFVLLPNMAVDASNFETEPNQEKINSVQNSPNTKTFMKLAEYLNFVSKFSRKKRGENMELFISLAILIMSTTHRKCCTITRISDDASKGGGPFISYCILLFLI